MHELGVFDAGRSLLGQLEPGRPCCLQRIEGITYRCIANRMQCDWHAMGGGGRNQLDERRGWQQIHPRSTVDVRGQHVGGTRSKGPVAEGLDGSDLDVIGAKAGDQFDRVNCANVFGRDGHHDA